MIFESDIEPIHNGASAHTHAGQSRKYNSIEELQAAYVSPKHHNQAQHDHEQRLSPSRTASGYSTNGFHGNSILQQLNGHHPHTLTHSRSFPNPPASHSIINRRNSPNRVHANTMDSGQARPQKFILRPMPPLLPPPVFDPNPDPANHP